MCELGYRQRFCNVQNSTYSRGWRRMNGQSFCLYWTEVKLIDAEVRLDEDFSQYQLQIERDITQEPMLLSQIQFIQPEQISAIQTNI